LPLFFVRVILPKGNLKNVSNKLDLFWLMHTDHIWKSKNTGV